MKSEQRTIRAKGTSPLSSPWMIPIGLNDCCNGTLQLQKALNSMVNYQVTHCLNLKFFKVSQVVFLPTKYIKTNFIFNCKMTKSGRIYQSKTHNITHIDYQENYQVVSPYFTFVYKNKLHFQM